MDVQPPKYLPVVKHGNEKSTIDEFLIKTANL